MASNKKQTPSKKKKGSKTYTFKLTLSGLCSLSLLTIIVMVWIFIFGVLVGRGYQPESFFPQLARIIPGSSEKHASETSKKGQDEILKAEELGFYEELESVADNTGSDTIEKSRKASRKKKRSETETKEVEKSSGPQKDTKSRQAKRYAYIYQVSAFKDLAQAKRTQAELRKLGIPSSMKTIKKEGDTWHRIYVPFKGRPEETRQLKAKLRTLGIKSPFLRSKKEL
jgi:cell division protein FtsN